MKRDSNSNLKYLTRLQYYGKLLNWVYVNGAMVLEFACYTATEHFAGSSTIRVYVPTEIENDLRKALIVGDKYFIICAPYKLSFHTTYRHRVDLLLNIFQEII